MESFSYIFFGLLLFGYRLLGLEYGYCRIRRLNLILLFFLLFVINCIVNLFCVVLKDRRLGKFVEDRIVLYNFFGGNFGISFVLFIRGFIV